MSQTITPLMVTNPNGSLSFIFRTETADPKTAQAQSRAA